MSSVMTYLDAEHFKSNMAIDLEVVLKKKKRLSNK